jgi:hypothetical protein
MVYYSDKRNDGKVRKCLKSAKGTRLALILGCIVSYSFLKSLTPETWHVIIVILNMFLSIYFLFCLGIEIRRKNKLNGSIRTTQVMMVLSALLNTWTKSQHASYASIHFCNLAAGISIFLEAMINIMSLFTHNEDPEDLKLHVPRSRKDVLSI